MLWIDAITQTNELEVTQLSLLVSSTITIPYAGIHLIDVTLGCNPQQIAASSSPSPCVSSLIVSSLFNTSITIDVNEGVDNDILIGRARPSTAPPSSPSGLDAIKGTIEINGALKADACAASLTIDHYTGTPAPSGAKLSNADLQNVGKSVVTYYQICSIDLTLGSGDDHLELTATHTGNSDNKLLAHPLHVSWIRY